MAIPKERKRESLGELAGGVRKTHRLIRHFTPPEAVDSSIPPEIPLRGGNSHSNSQLQTAIQLLLQPRVSEHGSVNLFHLFDLGS